MKNLIFPMILSAFVAGNYAVADSKKLDVRVFFIEPADGATVPKTFKVKMGVSGMSIAKAGEEVQNKLAGHHHLLVDQKPIDTGTVVPADEHHLHFGKGQTDTEITLPPGLHKLTLQFADGAHASYGPNLSTTITVNVKK